VSISWGDVGYINRWTMEITNNSRYYSIPLVVGRRIAQIVFFDSDGTIQGRSYEQVGKYQAPNASMDSLIEKWVPESMLPQMFLDRVRMRGGKREASEKQVGAESESAALHHDKFLTTLCHTFSVSA
jgi:hypothetical protein